MDISNLEKDLEALKKASGKHKLIKVSPKGAVSVYGIHRRFPVTLYPNQWKELLELSEQIKSFIEAHKEQLSLEK